MAFKTFHLAALVAVGAASTSAAWGMAPPAATQPAIKSSDLAQDERAALLPVQNAIEAKDWQTARAALNSASPAVHTGPARYALGRFQLEIGLGLNDVAMQAQGLDNLLASGKVPAADLPIIYRNRAVLANNAGDKRAAEAAFAKVVELAPQDPEALVNLAQVKKDLNKPRETVQLLERAIALKTATGLPADESWYKYALKIAFDGRSDAVLRAQAQSLSRQLSAAYPTKDNWRDSLLVFRDVAGLDASAELDVLRLMRASGALAGERDWYDLADGLATAGDYAEAKAVLDDGIAKRMIDPNKAAFAELNRQIDARLPANRQELASGEAKALAAPTGSLAAKIGDGLYGFNDHAKAVTLYRAALRKGGVDANAVKLHLALALLGSGDRAAAEAMLKSLTGPRKDLGAFWLEWLRRS